MSNADAPLPGLCVLLVDDDPDTREMYRVVLTARGYRVLSAAGSVEALSQLAQCLPDVIVAEVSIPQGDAIDLIRRFRAEPRTARIPVIVLTAWTDAPTYERIRKAGAAAVEIKPCLPEALALRICKVIDESKEVPS